MENLEIQQKASVVPALLLALIALVEPNVYLAKEHYIYKALAVKLLAMLDFYVKIIFIIWLVLLEFFFLNFYNNKNLGLNH